MKSFEKTYFQVTDNKPYMEQAVFLKKHCDVFPAKRTIFLKNITMLF